MRRAFALGASCALLLTAAVDARSAFPGLNGRIAFVSNREGPNEIYTVNADGSGLAPVTSPPAAAEDPAWSANGALLAFGRQGKLWIANADGTGAYLVGRGIRGGDPSWSPDATRLAFTRTAGRNQDVYSVRADGTGLVRLTSAAAPDQEAAWSPDGRTIAFSSRRRGNWDIWVANADGSGERALTRSRATEGLPAWSPDGRRLAFWRAGRQADIWLMNADASGQRRLTSSPSDELDPAWSPDGTLIAFTRARRSVSALWLMNADGSGQRRLTSGRGDAYADWQPLIGP